MGKIFCLIGKSASGKDSLYRCLMNRKDLNLKPVVPYTTRPIRSGEKNGETYYFCSDEQTLEMEQEGKIIELRSYQTVAGIWKYFTVDDGQIELNSDHRYLMIGTLESYTKIRDYFGIENVIPIYITLDDGERLERALHRERMQEHPGYAEMCRRYLADEKDFAPDRLKEAGITCGFQNDILEDTAQKIAVYMKGVI